MLIHSLSSRIASSPSSSTIVLQCTPSSAAGHAAGHTTAAAMSTKTMNGPLNEPKDWRRMKWRSVTGRLWLGDGAGVIPW